jgi:glycosyltransferase involved in cell wall biosynthesis
MKTIFFISPNGFPSKNNRNVGIFTLEQAKALEQKKNPILIDLATNKKSEIYSEKFDGITIYRIPYAKYNLLKICKNFFFLKKLIIKYDPELIICSFLNLRNFIYTHFLNVEKTIIIHGTDAVVCNIFVKFLYYLFLSKIKKIIVVSNYTKQVFLQSFKRKFIKEKVLVIQNGISINKLKLKNKKFHKNIPSKRIIISCVANFVTRKNIPFLIEVFNYLNSRNPQKYHLIIAGGRGNEENKIKETIQLHKLKNNISVMQNLLNSEISALLNKSNFFCLFSKKQKNEFEGFGIVFIEAMYTKNIVFTSKHGAIEEIVKNNFNGFSFDLEKPNIKEKIVKQIEFTNKNNLYKKMIINNAFNYSLNFSWKKNINKILNECLKK